jgi:hypothetical protein
MKRGKKVLFCILGGLVLCGLLCPGTLVATEGPYSGIFTRNPFGLKPPPPPPPDPALLNKPPPPKLTLTGITTLFGNKRALIKGSFPPKPGDPAKEQFLTLSEGERQGEVEVLTIDEKKGEVTVVEFGVTVSLTFPVMPATPAPPPVIPGIAPAPVPGLAVPVATPGHVIPAPVVRPIRSPISLPQPSPAGVPPPPPSASAIPIPVEDAG